MSLDQFLEKDTFLIAAASALLSLAKMAAANNDQKEKEEKYEDLEKEVEVLMEKYKVTDTQIMDAGYDLDNEMYLDNEELIDRADKLVAREAGWRY
jgi:hypothetical protein